QDTHEEAGNENKKTFHGEKLLGGKTGLSFGVCVTTARARMQRKKGYRSRQAVSRIRRCFGLGTLILSFCMLSRCKSRASQALLNASARLAALVMISGKSGKSTAYAGCCAWYVIVNT